MEFYFAALLVVTAINAAIVVKLLLSRVQNDLPWLMGFLSYQLLQCLLELVVPARSAAYQLFYTYLEPLNWVFYIMLIREMYRLTFAGYPGIASVSRWSTYGAFGLAAILSVVMVSLTPAYQINHRIIFGYIIFWEKCACFALSVFVVLMVFVLYRYPLRLSSNLLANIAVFTVYFVGIFASLQISSTETPKLLLLRNYLMLLLAGLCYLGWGFFLKSPASITDVQTGPRNLGEQRRLLDQLGRINDMLVKAFRQEKNMQSL